MTTPHLHSSHSGPAATAPRAGIQCFYNASITTMDKLCPVADTLITAGDRILFCGPADQAPLGLNWRGGDFADNRAALKGQVRFYDLGGRHVMPGICDAHVHILMWAEYLLFSDLAGTRSQEDCIEILREQAASAASGEWLHGGGWSHNLWDVTALPSKRLLDEAFPDNPIILKSKCAHLAWVNSAALAAAGIQRGTPSPYGGEIEVDPATGEPTGILKETAIDLVATKIPPLTRERRAAATLRAQEIAHSYGLTHFQCPEQLEDWRLLQDLNNAGDLTLRINFWMPVACLDDLLNAHITHGLGDNHLRISAIKVFSDGSLGGRTALMYDPYEGEPDNIGIEVTSREEILEKTLQSNRAGLSMAIHAIGDLAADYVISAYEAAAAELGTEGDFAVNPVLRNRIEHLQVFSDRDLDRLRKLKPIISMQPIHLCADMGPADQFWGKDRARLAYACRTVKDAGCLLVFGSDAPVEPINPFLGMYAAITRCNLDCQPAEGWNPQEKLTLEETLEAYTINCAIAAGQESELGSLTAGKLADFVVLPYELKESEPLRIRDCKPVATFSGAQCVYAGPEWSIAD